MKNIRLILIFGVLIIALAAAAVLVQKNQETRKSAYFSTAKIRLLPTNVNKTVGQDVPVHVWVETANEAKADGVRAVLCYGDGSKIGFADAAAANAAVTIGAESGMTSKIVLLKEYDGKKCINVTFTSDNDASLLKAGSFEVGVINFKALAAGSVTVETVPARGEVSGSNPSDPIDKAMQLDTAVSQVAVGIMAGEGEGPTPTLDYYVSTFLGETLVDNNPRLTLRLGNDSGSNVRSDRVVWAVFSDETAGISDVVETSYDANFEGVINAPRMCSSKDVSKCIDFIQDHTYCVKVYEDINSSLGPNFRNAPNYSRMVGSDCEKLDITDLTSDENTLSFKMTYLGVKKSDEHASADSWKISAVVMGGGVTKVFTNIAPTKLSVVSTVAGVEMRTYRVNLPLAGFSPRQDLAVFVRGQKHIQVKYGKDGQNAFYNQTGGELDVVADKVFDFTAYPLLPGDITGPTRGVQDGKIDGRDWVFVNEEVQKRGRGEAWDVKADLDANATVNSADLSVLTQSLLERQSQLY